MSPPTTEKAAAAAPSTQQGYGSLGTHQHLQAQLQDQEDDSDMVVVVDTTAKKRQEHFLLSKDTTNSSSSVGGGGVGGGRASGGGGGSVASSAAGSVLSVTESIREGLRASLRSVGEHALIFDSGEIVAIPRRGGGGQATIMSEVFNISKNLIGSGVLSLPEGIAIFSNQPRSVFIASFTICLLGTMFGYFCLLIAKSCAMTGSVTYRGCYQNTVGLSGGILVAVTTAALPALGNLSYSTMLSQTLQSLLQTVHIDLDRVTCLFLVTVVAILPLCLLKNIDAVAPYSVLANVGILVTAACMVVRATDGTYQPGGTYFDDLPVPLRPNFAGQLQYVTDETSENGTGEVLAMTAATSGSILPFVCMVFESWVMHYNSPRLYAELKDASIGRFALVVTLAFSLTALIYMAIATAGFLTFGGHSDGYILNNYSPHDPLATLSRLFVGISTLVTFPLAFIGFRDGVLDVFEVPAEKQTTNNLNALTLVLLTGITVTAVFCSDMGMINAVAGGSCATALCIVFPALMFRRAVQHQQEQWMLDVTTNPHNEHHAFEALGGMEIVHGAAASSAVDGDSNLVRLSHGKPSGEYVAILHTNQAGENDDDDVHKIHYDPVTIRNQQREVAMAMVLMVVGTILGLIGLWQDVADTREKNSKKA